MILHTDRAIIVEGRYDKIKLSGVTDALILTTEGFGIFNDREKQILIKKTAEKRGLLIATDSDAAGFKIRNFIKNIAVNADILHVYIPDVLGKEKRKTEASKEGKLGVEGIETTILIEALMRSGAFSAEPQAERASEITVAHLFDAGLTGKPGSTEKRRKLLKTLGLPQRLTGASFLSVLNSFMSLEEFLTAAESFGG